MIKVIKSNIKVYTILMSHYMEHKSKICHALLNDLLKSVTFTTLVIIVNLTDAREAYA